MTEAHSPDHRELDIDKLPDAMEIVATVSYYLQLRLLAKEGEHEVPTPAALYQIAELAKSLPRPTGQLWGKLASGKLPSKKAARALKDPEGKPRTHWTDDSKEELVKMVDDAAFRETILGKEAHHQGHPNWSAMSRHFGFSGTAPLHRMYKMMTDREAPGVKTKEQKDAEKAEKEKNGGEDDAEKKEGGGQKKKKEAPAGDAEPAAKKPKKKKKKEEDAEVSDGWTQELKDILVRLCEDEAFRKQRTGKSKFKWSRVADTLGFPKQGCKDKYKELKPSAPSP